MRTSLIVKGRTHPLQQLPPEVAKGTNLVIGKGSTSLFMGSVDRNTVTWALTQKVPQSQANEMNETFRDPSAAQVNFITLSTEMYDLLHSAV